MRGGEKIFAIFDIINSALYLGKCTR